MYLDFGEKWAHPCTKKEQSFCKACAKKRSLWSEPQVLDLLLQQQCAWAVGTLGELEKVVKKSLMCVCNNYFQMERTQQVKRVRLPRTHSRGAADCASEFFAKMINRSMYHSKG